MFSHPAPIRRLLAADLELHDYTVQGDAHRVTYEYELVARPDGIGGPWYKLQTHWNLGSGKPYGTVRIYDSDGHSLSDLHTLEPEAVWAELRRLEQAPEACILRPVPTFIVTDRGWWESRGLLHSLHCIGMRSLAGSRLEEELTDPARECWYFLCGTGDRRGTEYRFLLYPDFSRYHGVRGRQVVYQVWEFTEQDVQLMKLAVRDLLD